jgi:membrane fusion protein (multidrug efflux system)
VGVSVSLVARIQDGLQACTGAETTLLIFEMNSEETKKPSKRRKIRAYVALGLVVAAVIAAGWFWYRQYEKYYKTDDAYIDADRVAVSSKILGRITNLYADEGDTVRKGMLLVTLDSSDLVAQRLQAQSSRDQAKAMLEQSIAKYELDQKGIRVQEINLQKAKEDLDRATLQFRGNVIPKEQFDHTQKAFEAAQAQLETALATLPVSKSAIATAEANINNTIAQIGTIETNLRNTRIYAPASGRVARRWLLPGDVTQPGQSILTITKDSLLWVTAYFEETKIGGIRNQQEAQFTVDAFPGVTFYGKVYNISTNTAAQFSLIPPNNASGNFTKVTQRIPVKISILRDDSSDTTILHRLVSGMSVIVKIQR